MEDSLPFRFADELEAGDPYESNSIWRAYHPIFLLVPPNDFILLRLERSESRI